MGTNGILDRLALLEPAKLDRKKVTISKGDVLVRLMRADERSAREAEWMAEDPKKNPGKFRRELLATTIIGEDGERLLKPEDAERFMKANRADDVEKLFDAACELNGLTSKDVEKLAGN